MKRDFFHLVMVIILTLSACTSPTATDTGQPAFSDQVATVVATTMEAFPSQPPEPTAGPACPQPETGTQLLRNEEYEYCFLFPDGYVRLDPLPYEVCLVLEGPSMACHGANLIIEVHDALGRTASQIADEKTAELPYPDIIERVDRTVGGEEAVVVDGLSAVAASRNVFIIHADHVYDLMFIPWDEAEDEFATIETLYNTVVDSFTFVP